MNQRTLAQKRKSEAANLSTTISNDHDTRERGEQMRRDIAPAVTTMLQQQGELVVLPETANMLADIAAGFMVDLATQSSQLATAAAVYSPAQTAPVASAVHVAGVVRRHPVMHSKASHVVQIQQQSERPAGGNA